jgi:hypothetical protein
MHRAHALFIAFSFACGSSSSPPPRTTAPQDSAVPDTAAADVLVTADASRSADLPPLTIRGRVPSGLHVSSSPHDGYWFTASGPPGGPLGIAIRVGTLDGDALHLDRGVDGFAFGTTGSLELNGTRWSTATWVEGQSLGRSAHLALWRRADTTIIVVDAYWGDDVAPPAALTALPDKLRALVDTLVITL